MTPEPLIIGKHGNTVDLLQIRHPAIAYFFTHQFGQARIAVGNPAPWSYPVGFVIELVRPELIKITEQPLNQQL